MYSEQKAPIYNREVRIALQLFVPGWPVVQLLVSLRGRICLIVTMLNIHPGP